MRGVLCDGSRRVLVGSAWGIGGRLRAVAADEAGLPRPEPKPEEAKVLERLADLRRRAVREGWPPPPRPWGPAVRRPGDRS